MGYITVVSGHPRSGTSMMMRMLHLGGKQIVADIVTTSYQEGFHNKYGSFEVNNLDWILRNSDKVEGAAVKIVTQYCHVLERLLTECKANVKCIFMERSLTAIHKSLKKQGVSWDPPPIESIALGRKILDAYKVPTLFVNFADAIKYPVATSYKVMEFLGETLDLEGMVSAIDPVENHNGG